MTADPLHVAILGCGRIARRFHIPVLATHPAAEVVSLMDRDRTALAAASRLAPDATTHLELSGSLDHSPLDAAVICLPNHLHADAAAAAFERRLSVYIEKPLATTIQDADRVLAAADAAGAAARIGFNFRFHPLVEPLRRAVRSGEIGRIVGVQTIFCAAPRDLPAWKRERRTGGGALLDLASHHVDLTTYLLGTSAREVGAMVRAVDSEDDTAVATLRLEDGTLTTHLVSIRAAETDRIEVTGTEGRLVLDRYGSRGLARLPARRDFARSSRIRAAGRVIGATPAGLLQAIFPPSDRSFAGALGEFIDAARGRAKVPSPAAGLEDGRRSLEIVLAAEAAARSGRTLQL